MVDPGEWTLKGATLSDATACKEYGVDRKFILEGVKAGHLEYREASMYGNPCIRLLRSQLEKYVIERLGVDYLSDRTAKTELTKVKREIGSLKRKLLALEKRKYELEVLLKKEA